MPKGDKLALITPDLSGIVDGAVGDAADWTTPMNTIINEFNGNIDNDNIKTGANIDTSKLSTGAWTSFTPTMSTITVGNGNLTCAYIQIGKIVIARYSLVFGSTTSMSGSACDLTLPVTAKSTSLGTVGIAMYMDVTGYFNTGMYYMDTVNRVVLMTQNPTIGSNVVGSSVTGTAPFTWATGDGLTFSITYEAA